MLQVRAWLLTNRPQVAHERRPRGTIGGLGRKRRIPTDSPSLRLKGGEICCNSRINSDYHLIQLFVMPANKPARSALDIIFGWSHDRPAWQRDALRRIVLNGSLSDEDDSDLVALCKKEHGDSAVTLTARPLTKGDLPATPGAGESISLCSLSGIEGVNQLARDQELAFGRPVSPSSMATMEPENQDMPAR